MDISVIIPTYNEEQTIGKTLDAISRLVNVSELVIVDGGSTDRTLDIAETHEKIKNTQIVSFGRPSRGLQMHLGTEHATGDIFWFVYADARPVQGSGSQIKKFMKMEEVSGGHFEVYFKGGSIFARMMTALVNQAHTSSLVYGETAIFTSREMYERAGGFRDLPKFEDVDFGKRLLKLGRLVYIDRPVEISDRRFGKGYWWRFLKWIVRQSFYSLGIPPRFLSRAYLPNR
ncbi:MAG: glycosyltransferase [Acidobacteria bacterium]|nr:MAG: glycosyltransferase [Acidobacteriota bacterium]REJ98295.1 MAG: glycosyltransferase [Acidobacteriota bacterium]REK17039.1 MAG: glycosyltransferase [Acidobacteriota bacterium]REK42949.1 MAG: glycosyltransferase [Acidobacteriota bacterium]